MLENEFSYPFSELSTNPVKVVDEILQIMSQADQREYIGEPVSQLEHSLQCAHWAVRAHADDEVILAALLHDIGHLCAPDNAPTMEDVGVCYHEDIGANFLLLRGFSTRLTALIRGHVQAKRYLVFRNPHYTAQMSQASHKTLLFQGGPMNESEALAFEKDPLFKDKLRIRHWDELSKEVGKQVEGPMEYKEMILRHLLMNQKSLFSTR